MSRACRSRLASLIAIAGFGMLWALVSDRWPVAGRWASGTNTQFTSAPVTSAQATSAQVTGGQAASVPDDRPASQVFKNIQVLKDIPASQLELAMDFMAASLGVGCYFCHSTDMASDEKSTKATTRQMLVMTANINKQSFSGFKVVNCYTCHRGRSEPASVPEADESIPRPQPGSSESSAGLPGADLLIAKYENAIGGVQAIEKVTTCILAGSEHRYGPGQAATDTAVKIYHKAPDKFLYVADASGGLQRRGFDGKSEWQMRDNKVELLGRHGGDSAEAQSDFYQYLRLKRVFPSVRVLGREKIGDREVVVAGAASPGGARVKLYFDGTSGLLVRSASQIKTPLGTLPDIVDFEDYRAVNGVAFPFRIKRSRPPTMVVQEFTEIKVNPPIDDSIFSVPQSLDRRRDR